MALAFHTSSGTVVASCGASITLTKPSGTLSSNLLLALLATYSTTGGANTPTAPAGWTLVGSSISQADGSNTLHLSVFRAAGSVTTLTWALSQTGTWLGWGVGRFSGHDATTPIDAVGTPSAVADNNSLTGNSVTIITDQSMLLHFLAFVLGTGISTTGQSTIYQGTSPPGYRAKQAGTVKPPGATGTFTHGANGGPTGQIVACVPFAVRPEATAAGEPGVSGAAGAAGQLLRYNVITGLFEP